MKTRVEILAELYRSGWVEMDVRKFLGAADRIYADDIIAELWLIICELPARLVEEIYGGCGEECLRRYISGLIKAFNTKTLDSKIGFKGILKKALCLMIVGLSVALQNVMPEGLPLREITILFFIANEGISVLENAAGVIPLPKKLLNVLVQIREENGEETALEIKDEEDMTSQE